MAPAPMTMEFVVNKRFGAFALSVEAAEAICARKGIPCHRYTELGLENRYFINDHDHIETVYGRADPDMIAVVKEMGERANGPNARLEVVKVTIGIEITNELGIESVHLFGYA